MNFQDWKILRELREKFLSTVEMAFVFGSKENNALLFTSDDRIFCVGDNPKGCLGSGNTSGCGLPYEMSLSKRKVKGLVCGDDGRENIFFVAYLYSGEIYWWGSVSCPLNDVITSPRQIGVELKISVKKVACGGLHCVILSDDGKVFTCGLNLMKQLGYKCSLYPKINDCWLLDTSKLTRVEDTIKNQVVVDVSCGYDFSVVLLDTGKVVTWGNNDKGQLGIIKSGDCSYPVEVTSLQTYYDTVIKKIACGRSHVIALSETGTLYTWGSNSWFQLGISCVPTRYYGSPLEVEVENLRFTNIGAHYLLDTSVAQCENGKVYVWGSTAKGNIPKPTETECKSIDEVFLTLTNPKVMVKPIRRLKNTSMELHKLETVQHTTVSETLEKEFNNPDTSDLTIVVDDEEIRVHQGILKMRSKYFNVMITRWLEKNEGVLKVTIKEKSFAAMEAYLKYLYTDKLEVDLNLAFELLLLADEYGDDEFKSLCKKIIIRDMTADKVAEVFAFTRKSDKCKDLNEFCLAFALRHAAEVINSPGYKTWDMETITAFCDEYVKIKGNCR